MRPALHGGRAYVGFPEKVNASFPWLSRPQYPKPYRQGLERSWVGRGEGGLAAVTRRDVPVAVAEEGHRGAPFPFIPTRLLAIPGKAVEDERRGSPPSRRRAAPACLPRGLEGCRSGAMPCGTGMRAATAHTAAPAGRRSFRALSFRDADRVSAWMRRPRPTAAIQPHLDPDVVRWRRHLAAVTPGGAFPLAHGKAPASSRNRPARVSISCLVRSPVTMISRSPATRRSSWQSRAAVYMAFPRPSPQDSCCEM